MANAHTGNPTASAGGGEHTRTIICSKGKTCVFWTTAEFASTCWTALKNKDRANLSRDSQHASSITHSSAKSRVSPHPHLATSDVAPSYV